MISVEFFKKYAYIILGVICVLALGGLFLIGRDRPAGIVDAGSPIIPLTDVMAVEPEVTQDMQPPVTQPDAAPTDSPAAQDVTEVQELTMVMVHIVGAVRYPGVFEVPYGSRINYVLQLAGGYSEDANQGQVNLSAFVEDAMQIRIPAIGEELPEIISPGQPDQQAGAGVTSDGLVNINLASLTELQTLPGIGPVIAQNIIDFREVNNGFRTIEELQNVSRIGPVIFENMRDRVTID